MRHIVLLISYCFALSVAHAQVDVSVPLEGAVFQQDGTGFGKLTVQGTFNSVAYSQNYSNLFAELYAITPQNGIVIAQGSSPEPNYRFALTKTGTAFDGSQRVATGWYYLRIRALTNASVPQFISLTSPRKVGVGEVFIIAGQSNAQGLPSRPNYPPIDVNVANGVVDFGAFQGVSYDAVRVQPWSFDPNLFHTLLTDPGNAIDKEGNLLDGFTLINQFLMGNLAAAPAASEQGIAPSGLSLWYWARLGERLIDRFGVPVAFFNAAWGGTHIKAWSKSVDAVSRPYGYPTKINGEYVQYPSGQPYRNFRATLRSKGGIYGARAVLWLQGETDAAAFADMSLWNIAVTRAISSSEDYRDNLHTVIRQTRQDFGPVPWVIGQTSINSGIDRNHPAAVTVENGQALAVSSASSLGISQVFAGPNMNVAVTARRTNAALPFYGPEPVHFFRKGPDNPTDGLKEAGDAWYNVLEQLLANRSMQPVTPTSIGTDPRPLSVDPVSGMVSVTGPAATRVYWVADNNGTFDLEKPVCDGASVSCSSTGRKRAVLVDAKGNYTITQAVNFPYVLVNDTQPTPTNTDYRGYLDVADCNTVAGWAFDNNRNQQSVSVDVYLNGQKAATVLANQNRPDVANAYGISGYSQYGFSWSIPASYKNGSALNISVRYIGTSTDVSVSPKTTPACPGTPPTTPSGPCAAFTNGTQVAQRTGDPSVKIVVSDNGTCKQAVWSNGGGLVYRDWLVNNNSTPINGFTLTDIGQCLSFANDACTGTTPTPTPTPTSRCAAFTNGTQVGYRTGNPSVKIVVSDDGSCRRAIWSNGDGVVHRDWLLGGSSTAISPFTLDDIGYCLNFEGENCTRRPASVTPAPQTASSVQPTTATTETAPARISTGSEPVASPDELLAYPNPVADVLTVQLARPLSTEPTFTLTDIMGRTQAVLPYLTIVDSQRVRLTVRHLAVGQYVFRISGDAAKPQTVTFVKQ